METEESKESVSPETPKARLQQEQKPKRKKIMNEKALEQLKLAREKAAEKRRQLGEIKRREKNVKEEMLNKRIKQLEVKEKVAKAPVEPPSESESEAESAESIESVQPKREKSKKQSKPIDIAKKPRAQKIETDNIASQSARYEMKQRMLQDTYRSAYASLFPNHLYNMF